MKKLLALLTLTLLCGCQNRMPVQQEVPIEETPAPQEIVEILPPVEDKEPIIVTETEEEEACMLKAYLPLSDCTEAVLNSSLLTQLDALTINVGCYWMADGTLEVKKSLPAVLNHLKETQPHLDLSCTINPKKGAAAAIDTAEERAVLVENILNFCEEYDLSGADIDWEFPQGQQWVDFSALIVELSKALTQTDRSLSLAFYPEDVNLSEEAMEAVHSIHVMAYDQFDEQGYHSTYESTEKAIDYFIALGFREEQLVLGIPAYGRPIDASLQWPYYCDYAVQLADGTDLLGNNYFNSPQTAAKKAVFAKEKNLQGVFLYHLASDAQDEYSLITAIRQALDEL